MSCKKTSEIRLEAMSVNWGKRELTCVEMILGLTGGEYFEISTPSAEYYCWFDVDGTSTDPAVVGKLPIEVALVTSYTYADMQLAMKTALEAFAFKVGEIVNTSFVGVENSDKGVVLVPATVGTYTGTVEVETSGIGGDLGKTKDGLELSMEVSSVEIKSNQTGEILIDELPNGYSVAVSMSLLEMSAENWDLIVGNGAGGSFTPSGGTALTGYGSNGLYKSLLDKSGELVLHPVAREASDKSRDVTIWKCIPLSESISFSGTEEQVMSISFKAYIDESVNSLVNIFAFGDSSQDVDA